jgi:segregation and condensation protein B
MAETNTTNTPVVLQVPTSVKSLIEALIFGAREPLSVRQIQVLYEDAGTGGGEPRKIDYEEINRSVEELNAEFAASDRPYRIIQIAGGYQFATLPLYAEWLGKLYKEQTRRKLSQSSIETLAIVAYKQPITKPEIEAIRGVNCDYVLSALLEKDLATIVGRAPTVGRPLLYGTSKEFLRHFGLNDLNDLPRPREIQEILGDSQFETERRMLEAQQGGEEKKEEDFKSRLPHIPKRKSTLDNEVKILPKKRVRDIKVLPPEEVEAPKADAPIVEQSTEEPTSASSVPQEESEVLDVQTPMSEDVPIVENAIETIDAIQSEEQASEPLVEAAGALRIFDMPVPAEPETVLEKEGVVDSAPSPAQDEVQMPEVDAPREIAEIAAVEAEVVLSGLPVIPSIQVEEEEANVNERNGLQAIKEPIVQAKIAEVPEPVQERVIEEVPQEAAPTIEDHVELETQAEPEVLAEESHAESDGPHPKTRWKSWKEKIQGFIKKLFG